MHYLKRVLLTGEHICPWWLAYSFDNALRRWIHRPEQLLGAYVRRGMTVLDVGCGMGHFSLGLARMVGNKGRVEAVDLQTQMLTILSNRARDQGLADRIHPHAGEIGPLRSQLSADFVLTFWMTHEVPDIDSFMNDLYSILRRGGHYFLAEPLLHVSRDRFRRIVKVAQSAGFVPVDEPSVWFSRAAVFQNEFG